MVTVKVHAVFFAAALSKRAVMVAGLGVVGLLLQPIHFNTESGFRDSGLVLLRQVELTLLLKTCASEVLA